MKQVIIRALCDALGYTNLPNERNEHAAVVREAQNWFLRSSEAEDFQLICDLADVDATRMRAIARNLIQAKFSGDYTRVPEFWAIVFRSNRMPSLTNIERALDLLKKPS